MVDGDGEDGSCTVFFCGSGGRGCNNVVKFQERSPSLSSSLGNSRLLHLSVQRAILQVFWIAVQWGPVGVPVLENPTSAGELLEGAIGVPSSAICRRFSSSTVFARSCGHRGGLERGGKGFEQGVRGSWVVEAPGEGIVDRAEAYRESGRPHQHGVDVGAGYQSEVGKSAEDRKNYHRVGTLEQYIGADGDVPIFCRIFVSLSLTLPMARS